ncbi:CocE/NonD family hydrolase [Pseudohalioglobus sediminis]|uniref:CocE/NonD family hydrolase n=1 Tax=Pseudohalioglobus sediminis TaxID=2606449 RepID=A0A5B0WN64_9GAMM|nr:CocE/NonD family hydrolase [Pseudohalioglobus sediminis]KAA1188413.1 CocE/NonD family hydrolase [Pseudohalioglobus sediminis]
MLKLAPLLLSAQLALAVLFVSVGTQAEELDYVYNSSVMIPMRDGVELSTDFYFPKEYDGKLPLILVRTVYNKRQVFGWDPAWIELVSQGYALAIQDIRGRYESGGDYNVGVGRREDGVDTLDWITRQDWSNGKVALAGCSYQGESQVVLAATNHPALVTAVPMWPASGYYSPGRAWQAWSGGVFELGQTAGWFAGSGSKVYTQPPEGVDRGEFFREFGGKIEMTPTVDFARYLEELQSLPTIDVLQRAGVPPTDFETWRKSAPDGDYYRGLDLVQADDEFSIPALFMDSWYDYGATETLEMFAQFSANGRTEAAREHQYLVIGPGTHCSFNEVSENTTVGERPVGDARYPHHELQIDWYNYWMKGEKNGVLERNRIHYYQMGDNEWRSTNQWPPAGVQPERWYFSSVNGANSLRGDGVLSTTQGIRSMEDSFTYDPGNPVPSLGGHTCCTGTDTEAGGYDQRGIEQRRDVLVYTSEVLESDIEMVGRIFARLYVSSSARDTDFTVKLVDVHPDGTAYNIQEGALRMRYRNSLREAEMMTPGDIYVADIDLHTTANTFKAGHRIRVEVSSSNYPRLERNLNTGGNNYDETRYISARNRLLLGGQYASYIDLPINVSRTKVAGDSSN